MFLLFFTFSSLSFLSCDAVGMEMSADASSEVGYCFFSFRGWGGGKGRDMLSFHLCLWRLAFVSTFGQMKEKMEFKAKHLRAFKTVLLICAWLICNNTCGAGWALILPEMERSTFRLFFSDLSIQDTLCGIHPYIFIKKIQSSAHSKLLNMEIIVTGMSNAFLL